MMPTELELREIPMKQYVVGRLGNLVVWYDNQNDYDSFCLASADDGDCGDSFETYEELEEHVKSELGV